MQQARQNRISRSISIKIIVCCGLFASLLVWGWYTNQQLQISHNPPAIDHILEQHPSPDTAIVRAYEWNRAHTFQPRQYVKIIRNENPEP